MTYRACVVCSWPTFLQVSYRTTSGHTLDLQMPFAVFCLCQYCSLCGKACPHLAREPHHPLDKDSSTEGSLDGATWAQVPCYLLASTEDVFHQTCPHPCHFSNLKRNYKREIWKLSTLKLQHFMGWWATVNSPGEKERFGRAGIHAVKQWFLNIFKDGGLFFTWKITWDSNI